MAFDGKSDYYCKNGMEAMEEILSSRIKPDKERILEFSDSIATRIPYRAVFEIGADAVAAGNEILKELIEAGVPADSCPTLIFNYATLCAVARCALTGSSEYLVTPEDVRACACILRAGKCDSRKEMQEKIELKQCAKYKSENEVWAEIREKLQNPIRLDKLNEWIRRRPPVYAETYNKMRSRGETVEERSAEKKRGRIVRLATDEERQKAEEERQKAKASVFDRSTPQEYLLRCGRKGDDADALRDLEKAAAYIQREIKRRRTASDLEGLAKREAQE